MCSKSSAAAPGAGAGAVVACPAVVGGGVRRPKNRVRRAREDDNGEADQRDAREVVWTAGSGALGGGGLSVGAWN